MTDKYRGAEDGSTGFAEKLLRLPARNLESRIKDLEAAVRERQQISWDALSALGTEKLRVNDQLHRMRYAITVGGVSQGEAAMKRNQLDLDQTVLQELVGCFNDVQRLKEELRKAREDLTFEQQKLNLFKGGDDLRKTKQFQI